jgi:hypothetical protein
LTSLLEVLGRGVNYMGVDSSVVSRVYEETVVTAAARARQGIYYTPPDLAQKIARAVPFEEVPPEARVVLDPACGSGTLLLAAHDRLVGLLPASVSSTAQQEYLRGHVIGYDSDPFAAEIAKLSLLLHSLPFGNGWQVETRDALDESAPAASHPVPTIVLSNPPWRGQRSVEGRRNEEAIAFLDRMLQIVAPGGFVAAVLPASWLQSRVARASRERLREHTELFEIWRLPEGTFESAAMAPCVVFARATKARHRAWVYRRVRSEPSSNLSGADGVREHWLTIGYRSPLSSSLMRGPFDAIADALARLPKLSDIAEVDSAPVPEPGREAGEGPFWLLRKAGDLPQYATPDRSDLVRVRYPEDFHKAGKSRGPSLRRSKILVSAKRSPANPWRLKVGVDTVGVIPRESFHMVVPRSGGEDELFGLLALLGSRLASAWVDTYEPKRTIDVNLLRAMPVPAAGRGWELLADAGRRLHEAAASAEEVSAIARAVDGLIERLYGLPDHVLHDLDQAFAGVRAPEGKPRYPGRGVAVFTEVSPEDRSTDVFGAVLDVEGGELRLWIPGNTPENGQPTPLTALFPGWLCVPGATFDVVLGRSLETSLYRYQSRAYLDTLGQPLGFHEPVVE